MIEINKGNCEFCGACTTVCPSKSVLIGISQGELELNINRRKCNKCGRCVRVCPMRALERKSKENS